MTGALVDCHASRAYDRRVAGTVRIIHTDVPEELHRRVWGLIDVPDETLKEFVRVALERECERREKARDKQR